MLKKILKVQSAYLLVFHGSRDPRPQIAVERLAYLVRQQLEGNKNDFSSTDHQTDSFKSIENHQLRVLTTSVLPRPSSIVVETAALECTEIPLHQKIEQFAKQAQALGFRSVKIVPLFLLAGVHVKEDIPAEVALAQNVVGEKIKIELCTHLGSNQRLIRLLAQQLHQFTANGRILLSHGSRRLGGNQTIETLAADLQALPAYWSVNPSIAMQIESLVKKGQKNIVIIPYFLFNGTITDEIARKVQQIQYTFPTVELFLGQPLGATTELAQIIVEEMN